MSQTPKPLYSQTDRAVRYRTKYALDETFRKDVLAGNKARYLASERLRVLHGLSARISEKRTQVERLQSRLEEADRQLLALVAERERVKAGR